MANIHVALDKPISDGSKLKFRTPCDSTTIEGLEVKYPAKNGVGTLIKKFIFKDAHGVELSGVGNLFVSGVMIEVLLDVSHSVAYIQNADTNSYVESVKSEVKRLEDSQKQFLSVAGKIVEECEVASKFLYVGDGEMPGDALVQIDPNGEVVDLDAWVVERGVEITQDGTKFSYIKWSTGDVECWGQVIKNVIANVQKGSLYTTQNYISIDLPSVFVSAVKEDTVVYSAVSNSNAAGFVSGNWCNDNATKCQFAFFSLTQMVAETSVSFRIYARTINKEAGEWRL